MVYGCIIADCQQMCKCLMRRYKSAFSSPKYPDYDLETFNVNITVILKDVEVTEEKSN